MRLALLRALKWHSMLTAALIIFFGCSVIEVAQREQYAREITLLDILVTSLGLPLLVTIPLFFCTLYRTAEESRARSE